MEAIKLSQYHHAFVEQIKISLEHGRLAHGILLNNIDQLELGELLNKVCCILLKRERIDELVSSPDVFYLKSDQGQIILEEIKNMLEGIYLSGYQSNVKVVIISPLEALNTSAANALLKNLEEPPENTYFLMTSNHLQWIMPTLRSRIQVFDIALDNAQKAQYLADKYQMSAMDVTKALQISRSELKVIDQIKTEKTFWQLRKELIQVLKGGLSPLGLSLNLNTYYQDAIYWLTSFIIDAYYFKLGLKEFAYQDQLVLIAHFAKRYNHIALYDHYQRLLKLKAYEGKHFNINKQLAIESLLIELSV